MYKELTLWKSIDERSVACYRCFQDLVSGQYCVQNVDFLYLPVDESQLQESRNRFVELLIDVTPIERGQWFKTIEEAVADHDSEFLD